MPDVLLKRNQTKEVVPGGYLIVDTSYSRPVYSMYAVLRDGSQEFLGKTHDRREALYEIKSKSRRAPLSSRDRELAKKIAALLTAGSRSDQNAKRAPREVQEVYKILVENAHRRFGVDDPLSDAAYLGNIRGVWELGSNYEQFGTDMLIYNPEEGQWYYRRWGRDKPITLRAAKSDAAIWFTG